MNAPFHREDRLVSVVVRYLKATAVIACCSLLAGVLRQPGDHAPVAMLYLVGVVVVALEWGHGASAFACALSILTYDYFFLAPRWQLVVRDWRNLLIFISMLGVTQVVAKLMDELKDKVREVRAEKARSEHLQQFAESLAKAGTVSAVADAALAHGARMGAMGMEVWVKAGEGWEVYPPAALPPGLHGSAPEPGEGPGVHPLWNAGSLVGVWVLRFAAPEAVDLALLNASVSSLSMGLGRALAVRRESQSRLEAERERLRSTLLSSVSHDLRTPLSAITGAASALLDPGTELAPPQRVDLLQAVLDESAHLTHLLNNLLDMTRLESGAVRAHKDWQPLEEVVGAALARFESGRGPVPVEIDLPPGLPLVPLDPVLITQVLVNLLENAARHSRCSPGLLRLEARAEEGRVILGLEDNGAGIPEAYRDKVFEKFFQMPGGPAVGGAGLGLAVAKAMILAHGGEIWIESGTSGGARFCISLPLEGKPPVLSPLELELLQ